MKKLNLVQVVLVSPFGFFFFFFFFTPLPQIEVLTVQFLSILITIPHLNFAVTCAVQYSLVGFESEHFSKFLARLV